MWEIALHSLGAAAAAEGLYVMDNGVAGPREPRKISQAAAFLLQGANARWRLRGPFSLFCSDCGATPHMCGMHKAPQTLSWP